LLTPAEFDRLRVVLVSTRNPLNIGASARAMSNFGFRHLRAERARSKRGESAGLPGQRTSICRRIRSPSVLTGVPIRTDC
jgi:tRNA C32,U32 (ribose-2'-O)-methylase TrmJ